MPDPMVDAADTVATKGAHEVIEILMGTIRDNY